MAKPIVISILGDSRDLVRELGQAEGSLGKFGKVAGVAGKAVVAGLAAAGAAAVGFGVAAVNSASDAQQSLGATETVFGKYADTVIKRSNEASRALGISANEYRELSNVTGALLTGAGMPLKKVAGLTDDLNSRAADMAATFGGSTKDAVEAISSLMKGEADPIERYGVSIKQSDVNARMAAKGLDGLTGAAAKQAEMQTRVELLMAKTAKTSGAFAKESGTLAHQQQVLGAQWEDLKAKAGAALLPAVTAVFAAINDRLLPAISKLGPPLQKFGREVGTRLAKAWPKVTAALKTFLPVVQTAGATFTGTILPALTAVGTYLVSSFAPIFTQVGAIIRDQVAPALVTLGTWVYGTVYPALVGIASVIVTNLKPAFDAWVGVLQGTVLPAIAQLLAKFREWQPTMQRVATIVLNLTGKVIGLATAILGKVLPPAIKFAGFLTGTLISSIGAGIGAVGRIVDAVVNFSRKVKTGAERVKDFAEEVVSKITAMPGEVLGVFTDLASDLYTAGSNLIEMLGDGIEAGWNKVKDKISGVASKIGGFLPGSPIKTGPLKSWNNGGAGKRLMSFLAQGITPDGPVTALRRVALAMERETAGLTTGAPVGLRRPTIAGAGQPATVHVTLDAEQLHALEDGRRLALRLRPYLAAGGVLA